MAFQVNHWTPLTSLASGAPEHASARAAKQWNAWLLTPYEGK